MALLQQLSLHVGVVLLALIASQAWSAERKNWETLSDCQYVEKANNDGDSFHVKCSGREFVLRLYYVDAPEVRVSGNAERVRDQSGMGDVATLVTLRVLFGTPSPFDPAPGGTPGRPRGRLPPGPEIPALDTS